MRPGHRLLVDGPCLAPTPAARGTEHRHDLITGRTGRPCPPRSALSPAVPPGHGGWPRSSVSFSFPWQRMTSGCKDSSDGLLDIQQRQPNIWLHKVQMNHEHMGHIFVQMHRNFSLWERGYPGHKCLCGKQTWDRSWAVQHIGYTPLFSEPTGHPEASAKQEKGQLPC